MSGMVCALLFLANLQILRLVVGVTGCSGSCCCCCCCPESKDLSSTLLLLLFSMSEQVLVFSPSFCGCFAVCESGMSKGEERSRCSSWRELSKMKKNVDLFLQE